MRTQAPATQREEVIVRNLGADITLDDGTDLEAGGIAVVNRTDRVVAVEVLFGRFEVSPNLSGIVPSPLWPRPGGTEVGTAGVNVSAGVTIR